jgi:hypothetical protein
MNKTQKIIVYSAISLVICYFVYFLMGILIFSHSHDRKTYKQYMWLFKDSVKNDIDTNFSYSYFKKRDIYNNIHYKRINHIIIWEFKDLSSADLNKIAINQNVNLDNIKFWSGEVLNVRGSVEIMVNYGFAFKNMNLNLDNISKIERHFETVNYKGFYGILNKMSLSNEKGEHQIIFEYAHSRTPTVLLLYKGHKSFYLIMINSEKPFDESIIEILNLK